MDPIEIIKNDHRTVEALFSEYESLGDRAYEGKQRIVDQLIKELTLHAEMEETIAYPAFMEAFTKEDDKMVAEAYIEHTGAKRLMEDLQGLSPEDIEFDATVKVLKENIEHHVKEEEEELLPTAEKEVPEDVLEEIGKDMMAFKDAAADEEEDAELEAL